MGNVIILHDVRLRNRLREHTKPGHSLYRVSRKTKIRPDETLFKCSCSWLGWVPDEVAHLFEGVETREK